MNLKRVIPRTKSEPVKIETRDAEDEPQPVKVLSAGDVIHSAWLLWSRTAPGSGVAQNHPARALRRCAVLQACAIVPGRAPIVPGRARPRGGSPLMGRSTRSQHPRSRKGRRAETASTGSSDDAFGSPRLLLSERLCTLTRHSRCAWARLTQRVARTDVGPSGSAPRKGFSSEPPAAPRRRAAP